MDVNQELNLLKKCTQKSREGRGRRSWGGGGVGVRVAVNHELKLL